MECIAKTAQLRFVGVSDPITQFSTEAKFWSMEGLWEPNEIASIQNYSTNLVQKIVRSVVGNLLELQILHTEPLCIKPGCVSGTGPVSLI